MTALSPHSRSEDSHNMKLQKLSLHFLLSNFELWILVSRPTHKMALTQRSHYKLWLFWGLLCRLSSVIDIMTVLILAVWTQRSHYLLSKHTYICNPFSVYLFSLYSTITLNSCALLLQFLEIETAPSPLPPPFIPCCGGRGIYSQRGLLYNWQVSSSLVIYIG